MSGVVFLQSAPTVDDSSSFWDARDRLPASLEWHTQPFPLAVSALVMRLDPQPQCFRLSTCSDALVTSGPEKVLAIRGDAVWAGCEHFGPKPPYYQFLATDGKWTFMKPIVTKRMADA
jgi:hypothetical protein